MANGGVHSPLVKYVIFEKFRSDPEKDGSEVALAVDTSIHRDPVFGRLFSTFFEIFCQKTFCTYKVDLWNSVTCDDVFR